MSEPTHATHAAPRAARANFIERYRGMIVRVGVLIAVVVAVVFAVRYLTASGPNEKFRVAHPAGYSVVHPRDWEAGIIRTPDENGFVDAIAMMPVNWKGQQPGMWVRRYGRPPDLKKVESMGFRPVEFQGQPAWGQQSQPRTHLIRTAIFQRGDSWFNVSVALPGLEGARIDDYWKYIETFQTTRRPDMPPNPTTTPATTTSS